MVQFLPRQGFPGINVAIWFVLFSAATLVAIQVLLWLIIASMVIWNPLSVAISCALNTMTWNAIRRAGFGWDIYGERIKEVAVQPYPWVPQFQPLPPKLSNELSSDSDREAANSIAKLRAIVHQLMFFSNTEDVRKAVGAYLSWKELVHTSYFANSRFRKLVYYILANSDGFKPTEPFLKDPDYNEVAQWCTDIQPKHGDQLR